MSITNKQQQRHNNNNFQQQSLQIDHYKPQRGTHANYYLNTTCYGCFIFVIITASANTNLSCQRTRIHAHTCFSAVVCFVRRHIRVLGQFRPKNRSHRPSMCNCHSSTAQSYADTCKVPSYFGNLPSWFAKKTRSSLKTVSRSAGALQS